jgi:hypothetical protein
MTQLAPLATDRCVRLVLRLGVRAHHDYVHQTR